MFLPKGLLSYVTFYVWMSFTKVRNFVDRISSLNFVEKYVIN